uniref:BRO1 domain-containing protein n=1 Tax=Gongylonema pulchrum TaxID=637853 RepID=A0A183DFS5_9BILA
LLEKSLIDHRKDTVIAKLAVYLRDVYKQCREHLDASGMSDIVSVSRYKEWLRTCDLKCEVYGALAMLHLGCHADVEKKMGARFDKFFSNRTVLIRSV